MKAKMVEARLQIAQALGHSMGARFFRVLALGTLLVGAAALYSSIIQGEAGNQPATTASSQWSEVEELEAPVIGIPAYTGSQSMDGFEVEELEAAVIGIPASVGSNDTRVERSGSYLDTPYYQNPDWNERQRSASTPPIAGKVESTVSIDLRFLPGSLPED